MNQRRATILAVACLGLFFDVLAFTLPPLLVLLGLLPTVAILGTLTLRELHRSMKAVYTGKFKTNPLSLLGFSPHERAAEVEESLTYALGLTPLQAQEVCQVILSAYKEKGILEEDSSTWTRPPPTLQDVIVIMESRAGSGYYKGERLISVQWTISKLHRVDHRSMKAE